MMMIHQERLAVTVPFSVADRLEPDQPNKEECVAFRRR